MGRNGRRWRIREKRMPPGAVGRRHEGGWANGRRAGRGLGTRRGSAVASDRVRGAFTIDAGGGSSARIPAERLEQAMEVCPKDVDDA